MTTSSDTARELADALAAGAVALAELGWLVFPLHSLRTRADDDGRLVCTCGDNDCKSPGKHPAMAYKAAIERATSDVDIVKRWWKDRTKPRNVGVRCGRASGILVVDVDAGGAAGLAELERRHGPLPETLESLTPTGGRHLVYRYPAEGVVRSSREQLGPRINVIGEGDYVVAPPSLHRTGSTYTWVQRPVADLPASILAILVPEPTAAASRPAADLLSGEPAPRSESPVQVEWGGNPYAAATGRVTSDDVRPALEALATILAREELDPDAVIEAVIRANDLHCSPALLRAEAEKIAHVALAADHERRVVLNRNPRSKQIDISTAEGQAVAAKERREERSAGSRAPHVSALRAWVSTWFGVVDFDEHRAELRLTWTETGAVITLPVFGTPSEVERVLLRYTGSLESFAARAHEKANAKQFLRVLKDLSRVAPARRREDNDGAPIQLVRAILAMKVWVQTQEEKGETKRYPKMLSTQEGFYGDEGVGIVRVRGVKMLIVHIPGLASGAFRSNAEFRGSTGRELLELYRLAPGYVGVRRPREASRVVDTDFHAIELDKFAAIVGTNSEAVETVEFDSLPHSLNGENSRFPSEESSDSVRELPFPHDSRTPAGDWPPPDDVRECGNVEGTHVPAEKSPFRSVIDEVF